MVAMGSDSPVLVRPDAGVGSIGSWVSAPDAVIAEIAATTERQSRRSAEER